MLDLGKCPYCEGSIGTGDMSVFHSIPYCEKFDKEEPLVFLRNVRLATVGKLPDDEEWPLPTKQES